MDGEEREAALAVVRKAVFERFHEMAKMRVADQHRSDWRQAFDESGLGSGKRRATKIEGIHEDAAPVISAAMSPDGKALLVELYGIVKTAVDQAGGEFRA